MAPMYPFVSRTRRLWILGAVALPFLGLLLWSGLLISTTRATSRGFAHCSTWTMETSRHLGLLEELHEKATGLLHAERPEVEAAALDAAVDRLKASRQEIDSRTQGELDSRLSFMDRSIAGYLAQVEVMKRLSMELARLPEGSGKVARRWEALTAQAHLEHLHQTALGSTQTLARYHKDMLQVAIQSSQQSAARLAMFAAISLVIAVGFAAAGGIAIYQKHRSDLFASFSQTLLDTIPDGVIAWSTQGDVHKVNPGMAELLGTPSLHYGKGLSIRLLLADATVRQMESAAPGETLRLNLNQATGALLAVDTRVGRMDHPGGPTHIAVMRDVSDQVERERRMVESKWQIEVGRRACAIAKDLEYAMHPMLLAQEILKPAEGSRSSQIEAWKTFRRASEQATLLLRQFSRLAATAQESPEVRVFDLQVCLQEVIESFHLNRGTMSGVEVDLDPRPSPVRGPVNFIRRGFELLIQRALDAAEGGASIQVVSQQESDLLVVRILDPGHGESEAELMRMFNPVFCLPGVPMDEVFGLFNVSETLRGIGGEVAVTRAGNGWTEVTLTFPLEGTP